PVEPAAVASRVQSASAPARPPRSAPLPPPVLETKKVMSFFAPIVPQATRTLVAAAAASRLTSFFERIGFSCCWQSSCAALATQPGQTSAKAMTLQAALPAALAANAKPRVDPPCAILGECSRAATSSSPYSPYSPHRR